MLRIFASEEAACVEAAREMVELVAAKPAAVLGLPAGNTPRLVYAALARAHHDGALSFARAQAFNLDEYLGLPPDHPATFRRFMHDSFYRHVDLLPTNAHFPDAGATDRAAACARYEADIAAAGGLDFVLLGIGGNGHIAFNEPGAPFDSRTHVVTLADDTRAALVVSLDGEQVPSEAITMGVGTILSARRCVLLAFGAGKSDAIARALEGPVTPLVPASALRAHASCSFYLDDAAASRLTGSSRRGLSER